MPAYPKLIWDQLRAKTCDEIIKALERDDWAFEGAVGAVHSYRKGAETITVHRHPGSSYGDKLLKVLLAKTGWTAADLKRLKLIK